MHYLVLRAAVLAVLMCCLFEKAAFSGGLNVIVPPDQSYAESAQISVVLNVWSSMDKLQVSVNGRNQPISSKPISRYTMCYDGIRLSRGINSIMITGFKNGKRLEDVKVRIFFRSDLSADAGSAPPAFQRYRFHSERHESGCRSCHQLDFTKVTDSEQPAEKSPCYVCHKKILSNYAYVHGPSAVWSCMMCHDRASKDPKLDVKKPLTSTCANCHELGWSNKKYLHAPTAAGDCAVCHNPHASDLEYFLRMDRNELCTSCHDDIASRPHVIDTFSGNGGHPVGSRPDPLNPGRSLTCVSCHNPHGGNSEKFLNNYDNSVPLQHFCLSCHFR